ncbi:MAG: spore cortex biosynthesis protein YabQ [Acetatifactor muris]|nr:spore cortex biosynthesis protein YabQ [Acetatifactor muris]MCM1528000.1 spore cortex biosynthesis protein YabQ [Bacteroides sp.]
MADENTFMLHALCTGIFITFIYDILRILRRVIPHGGWAVSLEDLLFWLYCAVRVFLLMYHESNGTLRWFAVLGALAGMLLYIKTVSPFLVKYVSMILQRVLRRSARIAGMVLRPFVRLAGRIREKMMRAARRRAVRLYKKRELGRRIWKKKLTYLRKLLKINS